MVKVLREDNELKTIPIECLKGATLLSTEEAANLLTREERKCTYEGEECWWWLRSPGISHQDFAAYVFSNGMVDHRGDFVSFNLNCVRPALILNLQSSNLQIGDIFEFGNYKFKIISSGYALCEEAIGRCAFKEGGKTKDANVYEKSDIKTFVDNWFNASMQDANDIANNRIPDSKLWDAMDFGF